MEHTPVDAIGLACAAGAITLVASFFSVAMFMLSGTRQVARLRQRYLEASLKQEQAYYDTQATSGDVLGGLNEDCQAVQNAISEKVGNVIQHTVGFISAIIIALVKGWKLALVMMSMLPLIALAGALIAKVLTAGASVLSKGYSQANTTSSQAITNIRTVASFQAEEATFDKYTQLLDQPRRVQKKVSTFGGLAGGVVNCVIFFTCGAALCVSKHCNCAGPSDGVCATTLLCADHRQARAESCQARSSAER